MRCPKCQFDNPQNALFCGRCRAPCPRPKMCRSPRPRPPRPRKSGSLFPGRPSPGGIRSSRTWAKAGWAASTRSSTPRSRKSSPSSSLNPEIASDEQTIERFRNELKLARTISHRNICRMYDLGREEGGVFHHHGIRPRRGPQEPDPPDRAACRSARRSASPARSAKAWPKPTASASSIATSSRRTS